MYFLFFGVFIVPAFILDGYRIFGDCLQGLFRYCCLLCLYFGWVPHFWGLFAGIISVLQFIVGLVETPNMFHLESYCCG